MISIENLHKTYINQSGIQQEVLKDVNLEIDNKDSIAIVGPSGSGKTTFLNLLGSMDTATAGNIVFENKNISQLSENEASEYRNREIGFIFQQHHLLPQLTMMENILLPLLASKGNQADAEKRAIELLQIVGIENLKDKMPAYCSVGECQRAAVVRALINKPKLILADEPTGSLDEKKANELVDLLCKINEEENVAIIMVTHSSELAKKMKKVYKLSNKNLRLI
jgi:lipoprotein-releasing system ATP-binding protein